MTRRERLALALWLLVVSVSVSIVAFGTRFTADLADILPRSERGLQKILNEQLREGPATRLILLAVSGGDLQRRVAASQALAQGLRASGQFSYVSNGSAGLSQADYELVERYRYLLAATPRATDFSEAGLRSSLANAAMLMSSSAEPLVKRVLPWDPTLATFSIVQQWVPKTQPRSVNGVWFSQDGARALLIAETAAGGFDYAAQRGAFNAIERMFAALNPNGELKLQASGPGLFAINARETIHRDATRLSIAALVAVTALLFFAYRSVWLVVLSLLPVASGIIVAIASVSVGFGFVHAITLGFGITLLGEAVDYPTYVYTRMSREGGVDQAAASVWPTLRIAALTTVIGSMAMLLSGLTGLAQLGLLSMIGLAVALLTTRWILPLLTPKHVHAIESSSAAVSRAIRMLPAAPWLVWAIAAIAIGYLTVHEGIAWRDDLAALSPIDDNAKVLDRQLRLDLGAPDLRHLLVVRAANLEHALRISERVAPLLERLIAERVIEGYDMAARYLPSQALQRQRYARLSEPETIIANLRAAIQDSPFTNAYFAPFEADIRSFSRRPVYLTPVQLEGTAAGLKLSSLLKAQPDETIAFIPLHGLTDPRALSAALGQLNEPGVAAFDLKVESERILSRYRSEALRYSALGLAAIIMTLAIGLRSLRAALGATAPSLAAIVTVVAILTASGETLTLFHLVSLLLVLGVGVNYALFFNERNTDANDARRVFSVTLCAATTLASFGLLASSETPILRAVGMTVAGGILLSFIFSAMTAPHPVKLPAKAR